MQRLWRRMIGQAHVDVWIESLNRTACETALLRQLLSPDEMERARGLVSSEGRRRFITGRGLLRRMLGLYLDASPGEVRFAYQRHGKPCLAGAPGGGRAPLSFNLSHSNELVAIAVTSGAPIGVDIEYMRDDIDTESIARGVFSLRERAEWLDVPVARRREAFFAGWTRKEAFMKAVGAGFTLDSGSFDVSMGADGPPVLRRPPPGVGHCWQILDLSAGPHYRAALATLGAPDSLRIWRAMLPTRRVAGEAQRALLLSDFWRPSTIIGPLAPRKPALERPALRRIGMSGSAGGGPGT